MRFHFPPSFIEELKSRVPLSQVVAGKVKLKKAGREWKGFSPFNKERTPSFCVNDQKHRWFDFSAGRDGDVFAFIMETEGASFAEAVERVAGMAGISLPAQDPDFAKREARKLSLIEVCEYAQSFFQETLAKEPRALDYLAARGISRKVAAEWGLGFAPNDRAGLKARLAQDAIDLEAATEAGLIVAGDDIPVSYDKFRNRVTFAIKDLKGRVIAFGGRVIDDAKPKYLNSPETPIFHKGAILYNWERARQPAHDGAPTIVVEGYTATIASASAGFEATVATLGTALTEAHLLALWRMSDSPIICFDGDAAGRRAASKAIGQAFPLLLPGRTLRFASMPAGEDPDDVVRKRGAPAYRRAVEGSISMADMFWRTSIESHSTATVDARSKIEADMLQAITAIPDRQLREKYKADLLDRVRSLSRRTQMVRSNGHSHHSTSPGAVRLVHGVVKLPGLSLKQAILLAAMVASPAVAAETAEDIVADDTLTPEVQQAACQILEMIASLPAIESGTLMTQLQGNAIVGEAFNVCVANGITPTAAASVLRRSVN